MPPTDDEATVIVPHDAARRVLYLTNTSYRFTLWLGATDYVAPYRGQSLLPRAMLMIRGDDAQLAVWCANGGDDTVVVNADERFTDEPQANTAAATATATSVQ